MMDAPNIFERLPLLPHGLRSSDMASIRRAAALPAALLAASLAASPARAAAPAKKAPPPEKIVIATVGGEKITLADLDRFIGRLPENVQAAAAARKAEILQSLIHRALMYRYAEARKLGDTARAKREIARVRREVLIREAVLRIQKEAGPTEGELKAEYEGRKEQFREGGKVTASHIMVMSEKEAKDLIARLEKGEKFDELAKKHSLAPERARGGSLGTMERGHHKLTGLPEIIERTAFSLKPGTYSGAVKSRFGWHVVFTAETVEGKQLSFADVRARIEKSLGERKSEAAIEKTLSDMEKKYPVKKFPERLR